MKLIKTNIKDLKIIKTKIFKDNRGFLREVFKENLIKNNKFIFNLMSFSKKNVLRGLHIQTKNSQAKIITVTHGKIFDVVVDLRKKSKTFKKFYSIIISDKSDFSFYVPEGFAHGFLTLSDTALVYYKATNFYSPIDERCIAWNDSVLNINWPNKDRLFFSAKDSLGKLFKEADLFS